jgi:hypothetical protein
MRHCFFILSILSVLLNLHGQDISFKAYAEPDVLRTGEQFQLVYELNANPSELEIPEFSDFRLLGGPSTSSSSSIQIINGKTTRSVNYSYTYYLQAVSEGTYTIPPATAKIKKDTYQSNPVKIEVVKGSAPSPPSATQADGTEEKPSGEIDVPASENLFVRLHVDKTSAYVGEQIVAWIKIYSKVNLSQVDPNFKGPDFKGFFQQSVDIPDLRTLQRENVNGEIYGTGILRKVVLYPQRAGEIIIQPFEVDVAYQKQIQRRSKSIFDDFFGPSVQNVPVTLKSQKVRLNIKPLPLNRPASYTGAVGSFGMDASINKTEVTTNDAITLKINISGKGNVKLIDDLNIKFPPSLETFEPLINTVQDNALSGRQTFEYTIIPRYAGNYKIEPVEFTYFDPSSESYKTLKTGEFNITVIKGREDTTDIVITGLSKEDIKLLGSDILFIKSKPFKVSQKGGYIIASPVFYAAYIVSFLLFIAIIIIRRERIKRNSNIILVKNRQANKYARRRLRKALVLMKNNNHEAFYEEVLKAMWGYLSDKLSIPVARLSKDSSRQALVEHNVDDELINRFLDIIDTCEYSRFSPVSESEGMHKVYTNAISTIMKLQQKLR